jgi:hypothetical protein
LAAKSRAARVSVRGSQLEPPIAGLVVHRSFGDDLRAGLDRVIDRGADGAGGAVDLFECRRHLLEEQDRTGCGQRRALVRELLDLGRSFPHSLHGGLRAPAEGMPAKTRREGPLVRGGWGYC